MKSTKRTVAAAIVMAAPAIWLGHLVIAYGLIYVSCSLSSSMPLHLVSVLAMAGIGAGLVLTRERVRPQLVQLRSGSLSLARPSADRFGLLVGWLLAAYFLVVIAVAEVAFILAGPCL
jgi:hypothetical protein